MYKFGPNHATAATFAFRKELLTMILLLLKKTYS
jgi:hypothetical protein